MNIPFDFWKNASPKNKRIYSTIFMLILAISATLLGTLVPLSPADAQQISDELNQTVTQNTTNGTLARYILQNNFLLCLAMFIPLLGSLFGLFVLFSTGVALRAILDVQVANPASVAVADISGQTAIIGLIFVGLTFLLEYVSYAIGITESVWLFRRLMQKRWGELRNAAILIGVVACLLIIGAIVETWTIITIS